MYWLPIKNGTNEKIFTLFLAVIMVQNFLWNKCNNNNFVQQNKYYINSMLLLLLLMYKGIQRCL